MSVDGGKTKRMDILDECTWGMIWDSAQTAAAVSSDSPVRHAVDYENALGQWRDKHILEIQLGPNENDGHSLFRREGERLAR
jgi:hypothetical protein